jgi:hypothetical protein
LTAITRITPVLGDGARVSADAPMRPMQSKNWSSRGMLPVRFAGVEQVCSLVQGGPDYRDMPRAVGRGLDVLEIRCSVAAPSTLRSGLAR